MSYSNNASLLEMILKNENATTFTFTYTIVNLQMMCLKTKSAVCMAISQSHTLIILNTHKFLFGIN